MFSIIMNVGYMGEELEAPTKAIYTINDIYYDASYNAMCLDGFDNTCAIRMTQEEYSLIFSQLTEGICSKQTAFDFCSLGVFTIWPDDDVHDTYFVRYLDSHPCQDTHIKML